MKRLLYAATVAVFLCLGPMVAWAQTPGSGNGSGDPTLAVSLGNNSLSPTITTPVFSGDVVICDYGAASCNGSSTSDWQSVLVFYDYPTNTPFVTDATADGTYAYLYSTINGSLGTFLSGYDTGVGGADGLATSSAFQDASDAAGDFTYVIANNTYTFTAPPTSTPEPSSLLLLGLGLLGVAALHSSLTKLGLFVRSAGNVKVPA